MYTVFLPIGHDEKIEVRCSTFDELIQIIDHFGLAKAAGRQATSGAASRAPAARGPGAPYTLDRRLPHVKAAILKIGKPAMPKEIAETMQSSDEWRMGVRSPSSAVRNVLREFRDKHFVRLASGWWVKGEGAPDGSNPLDFLHGPED